MNRSENDKAFVDLDLTVQEFRKLGYGVIDMIAELIGYPVNCGGFFTSGGTMANFSAVLTAFRNVAPYDTTNEGLQREDRQGRFTIYMSDHEGHISIVRVADLLNLGRYAVRRVPSHDDFTMNVQALERILDEDVARGDIPFCVVGQVGSINVGAIDPLEDIAHFSGKISTALSTWIGSYAAQPISKLYTSRHFSSTLSAMHPRLCRKSRWSRP